MREKRPEPPKPHSRGNIMGKKSSETPKPHSIGSRNVRDSGVTENEITNSPPRPPGPPGSSI